MRARVGQISANRQISGMTLDSPTDVDFYRFRLATPINGNLGAKTHAVHRRIDSLFSDKPMEQAIVT